MTKSSEEQEQLSTWTVYALWWIEYLWNKVLTRVALWCVALMTGTYKPKVIKGWTPGSAAQIDRAQTLAAIDQLIHDELELHQCSFADLPIANKVFVQGIRRARARVAEVQIGTEGTL